MRAIVEAKALARAMRDVDRATARKGTCGIQERAPRGAARPAPAGRGNLDELVIREIPARGVMAGETMPPSQLLRDLAGRPGGPILEERETQQSFGWGSPAESQLVMARPANFVAHMPAISADEYSSAARDFDLGDWGLLAPVPALDVAA